MAKQAHQHTHSTILTHNTRAQKPKLGKRPGTPPTPELGTLLAYSNFTYHFPEID